MTRSRGAQVQIDPGGRCDLNRVFGECVSRESKTISLFSTHTEITLNSWTHKVHPQQDPEPEEEHDLSGDVLSTPWVVLFLPAGAVAAALWRAAAWTHYTLPAPE